MTAETNMHKRERPNSHHNNIKFLQNSCFLLKGNFTFLANRNIWQNDVSV